MGCLRCCCVAAREALLPPSPWPPSTTLPNVAESARRSALLSAPSPASTACAIPRRDRMPKPYAARDIHRFARRLSLSSPITKARGADHCCSRIRTRHRPSPPPTGSLDVGRRSGRYSRLCTRIQQFQF